MSEQSHTHEENIEHHFSIRIIRLETDKHIQILEALDNKYKFKWSVYFLSFLFVAFVYVALSLARMDEQHIFLKEVVGNFGFNLIFTFGFAQALMYSMIAPYLIDTKMFFDNSGEKHRQDYKKTLGSIIVAAILSFCISISLSEFWLRGEFVSSILDIALFAFIFSHMVKGLNDRHTSRQVLKIQKEYDGKIYSVIDEYFEQKSRSEDKTSINLEK